MYITTGTAINKLFENTHYTVLENIKKQLFVEAKEADIELPNYLIMNNKTGAIEFAVDQLPAAIQVSNKLAEDLTTLLNVGDVEQGGTPERQLQ